MLKQAAFCAAMILASTGCSRAPVERRASVDASDIQDIRIDYQHSGWGQIEEQFSLTPAADGTGFVLHATYFDGRKQHRHIEQTIPAHKVTRLVAMAAVPASSRDAGVRAVAAMVDRARIIEQRPALRVPPLPCTPQELQRLERLIVKRQGVVSLVDQHYGEGMSWTDDYPYVVLHVRFRNGSTLRMYSDSQKAMMLPWYRGDPVDSPLVAAQDWSLPLSRALREILPPRSSLYERLGGDNLPFHLNEQVSYQAGKECDAMRSAAPGRRG